VQKTELAIVITGLKRLEDLAPSVAAVARVVDAGTLPAAIWLPDDSRLPGLAAAAAAHNVGVVPQQGAGYGAALKAAFAGIDADFIATIDCDGSHPPVLLRYLFAARHTADIVIASRYVRQGYSEMPWPRAIASASLNAAFRRLLDLPFRDLSSGYRLYRRDAIRQLQPGMSSFAVLQEIAVKAYCEGYVIREIPMHYRTRSQRSDSVSLGIDYARTLRAMWRLRNSVDSCDYDTRAFYSIIPLQRYWQRRRYQIVTRYVGDAARVLDAGCGSTQMLNGAPQTIGMDPQLRKLRFMQTPGRRLVNGSTFALPFRSGVFDVVVSSQVIEHLVPDPEIFNELVRCIRPGGLLVLGTVDYGGWQWPLIERAYGAVKPTGYADEHITHYTRRSLFDLIARLGLIVEDHQYILGGEIIIKARKP
jgi:dolichol-phosphate mannosyltransferase